VRRWRANPVPQSAPDLDDQNLPDFDDEESQR